MSDPKFFEKPSEQSIIKTIIVNKYFTAWAQIITSVVRRRGENLIGYVDLFCGPGKYENGFKAVPILILEQAVKNDHLQPMLVTKFNDKDAQVVESLVMAISEVPQIEILGNSPEVTAHEVGVDIASIFDEMKDIPTLFFIDPWGYKGLTLDLISKSMKQWGCECIFFFNLNRIRAGLHNDLVKEHMDALFGRERADILRERLSSINDPEEREQAIIEEIVQALNDQGAEFVLPFRFKDERGTRTSHYLIFASKNFRGYEIMKDIMAGESSHSDEGVPSFEYSPADIKYPSLFKLCRPLDDLELSLLKEFSGRSISMQQLYEEHSVGTSYIKRNYKDVLMKMESAGEITAKPPADLRRAGTFAGHVIVAFPK